ncbi:MAG: PHB depolymerase family esterase [Polyangiaceae bacterium]
MMSRTGSRLVAAVTSSIALVACAAEPPRPAFAPGVSSARPYGLFVPKLEKRAGARVPLVLVLHGYSIDGQKEVNMLKLEAFAAEKGIALAWPDGTKDKNGYRFWNASDACCNWHGSGVDDVRYLSGVIDELIATAPIDPKRVYVIGHSNGAFMAHRLACERAEKVAAIASIAGLPWKDAGRCQPSEPVSVVQLHGTADTAIALGGGRIEQNPPYPSAREAATQWAQRNRCAGEGTESADRFDHDRAAPGPETAKLRFERCARGVAVELWTMQGSTHEPDLAGAGIEAIHAFFMAHPKP